MQIFSFLVRLIFFYYDYFNFISISFINYFYIFILLFIFIIIFTVKYLFIQESLYINLAFFLILDLILLLLSNFVEKYFYDLRKHCNKQELG